MGNMLFIVNPRSGREKMRRHLMDVLDLFSACGWEVQVHVTQAPLDAMETAARLGSQADLVVCSGGDGTLSETISGMMRLKRAPMLGYIPAGSTNDFASSLAIPLRYYEGGGKCGPRHALCHRRRPFLPGTEICLCGGVRRLYGGVLYDASGAEESAGPSGLYAGRGEEPGQYQVLPHATVERCVCGRKPTISAWRGILFSAWSPIPPASADSGGLVNQDVSLNDGLFEVLLIRTPRTPLELTNILSYMILKEERSEYVYRFRTSRLRIRSEEPVDWVLDGEFGGSRTEVEIENLSKRIEILCGLVKKS